MTTAFPARVVWCVWVAGILACAAPVEKKETIQRAFTIPPGHATHLEVDNVWGSIRVTGAPGREVKITAEKDLRAGDETAAGEAERDVKLEITQTDGTVRVYVDGPFRCHCPDGRSGRSENGRRGRDYEVRYDFRIEVPSDASLDLATVNDGDVSVRGVSGEFKASNVNGGIEMAGVSSGGDAHTVNGKVTIHFARNPSGPSSFRTINGDVDLYLQPGLSADVDVKTMHGEVYTDYEVAAAPAPATQPSRRDGRFVYRGNDFSRFRIGGGGPEFKIETLNGTIRIHNRQDS